MCFCTSGESSGTQIGDSLCPQEQLGVKLMRFLTRKRDSPEKEKQCRPHCRNKQQLRGVTGRDCMGFGGEVQPHVASLTHTHAYFWNAQTLGAAYVQKAPDPKWGWSSSQGRWWLSSQCSFLGAFCNLGKSLCCWKVLSHLPFP